MNEATVDAPDVSWREVRQVLEEELARLPVDLKSVIITCLFEGHTQEETSIVFDVCTATIKRWVAKFKTSGSPGGGYKTGHRAAKKIPSEKLVAYMEKHPDAFLKEIAEEFFCSVGAARKALLRNRYTLKKRAIPTKNVTKRAGKPISKG